LVSTRSYDPYPAIDAAEFGQRIDRLLHLVDWRVTKAQLNLLDSHDAPRLVSLARGDRATLRLAALLQMTFPGAPCVYYGDEIALRGTDDYDKPHQDPDARWPFPWHDRSQWDVELLAYYRQVIELRHRNPVLRHGRYDALYAQGDVYVFARSDASETLIVAVNAGEQPAELELSAAACPGQATSLVPLFGQAACRNVASDHWSLGIPSRAGAVLARRP
jgi:glycosidase